MHKNLLFFTCLVCSVGTVSIYSEVDPHDGKKNAGNLAVPDPKAAQLLECLAGIKKTGGVPDGIEINEANFGAVHFCGRVVTKDGFYKFAFPKMSSDGDAGGHSQLSWTIEKRDFQITLPNSKKKVRLAKLGGFTDSMQRALAITPFCDNKDAGLPELPLTKTISDDPENQVLSSCVKSALIESTSGRIRALINAVNEKPDKADPKFEAQKKDFRRELGRLGWPDKLKENVETWVKPCESLLSDYDKKTFFGDGEVPGGYIGFTKTLKVEPDTEKKEK